MNQPSFGVIVGRFQVHELHDGHVELINTVRGLHNRTIVFLGTPPTLGTRRNPLDFITRKRMLQAMFPDLTVLQMPDFGSDEAWSRELDKRIREVAQFGTVTLYGGRDSFVPVYSGQFHPVELPLTIKKSGEDVRAEISNTVMASPDFRAGVIYSTANRFPLTIPCVDVAIVTPDYEKLVLARKPNEEKWRFVGGHADPFSVSFEEDALREVREETGLEVCDVGYIGSALIDDWRYRKETDKIKTVFYIGVSNFGAPVARDDIAEAQWFEIIKLDYTAIVPAHRPLFHMLMEFLEID